MQEGKSRYDAIGQMPIRLANFRKRATAVIRMRRTSPDISILSHSVDEASASGASNDPQQQCIEMCGRLVGVMVGELVRAFWSLPRTSQDSGPLAALSARFDALALQIETRISTLMSTISIVESEQENISRDVRSLSTRLDHSASEIERPSRLESRRDPAHQSPSQDDLSALKQSMRSPLQILPEGSPSKGILAFLRSRYGGNLHDQGIVEVVASPCANGGAWNDFTVAEKNVLDFENNTLDLSECTAGRMIGYDFKTMRICPTHYSLRSNLNGVNGAHLKSWKIEVSDDISGTWVEIDQRMYNAELNKGQYIYILRRCLPLNLLRKSAIAIFGSHRPGRTGKQTIGSTWRGLKSSGN
jgi:hypothetical protein